MKKTIIIIISALMAISASATSIDCSEVSVMTDSKPKKAKKAKAEIKEVTFKVHLHCENCVKKVEENVAFEKGVKDLKVSLEDQTVMLKYDSSKTSEQALKAAIEDLGYEVGGVDAPDHEHNNN